MSFTENDLVLANSLDVEIKQLEVNITSLNKIKTYFETLFPNSMIDARLQFYYQEEGKDLDITSFIPIEGEEATFLSSLQTVLDMWVDLLADKQLEFDNICTI